MRIPRFFSSKKLHENTVISLDSVASRHAKRVLRLKPGDPLILFDGTGGEYSAVLEEVSSTVTAQVQEHDPIERESPLDLVLLQSLARGDRMDTAIQKAVELGVSRIIPVQAERSVVKLGSERGQKRLAHWRGVVRAACEQCGRNRLPVVEMPLDFATALEAVPDQALRLVLAPGAQRRLGELEQNRRLALLVGPEGGFTDGELALAERHGFQAVKLGPRILRTETAGIALIAAVQSRWGDMA